MSIRPILHFAAPLPKIESFQRYLFIGPHPDDIEIGAGATAARLAAEGKEICFLICADGRYGTDELDMNLQPEELTELRRWEAGDSAAYLGVKDLRFLDLCDGGFYSEEDLTGEIARVIGDFQPDVIFAPDPDVIGECHPDHTPAYLSRRVRLPAGLREDLSGDAGRGSAQAGQDHRL